MAENNEMTALAAQVAQLLESKTQPANQGPYLQHAGGALMAPPQSPLAPTSISFRIKIPLPDGRETSGYLHFDGSQCPTPQALQMLAQQVAAMWPIDAFMPRQQGGWGGQGGGGYQGGGGFQRGGGYGGRRW